MALINEPVKSCTITFKYFYWTPDRKDKRWYEDKFSTIASCVIISKDSLELAPSWITERLRQVDRLPSRLPYFSNGLIRQPLQPKSFPQLKNLSGI
jgi:hypothetical protein